ncbi:cyclin-like protein [Meredithblackwellia eburnea MCA 4105]
MSIGNGNSDQPISNASNANSNNNQPALSITKSFQPYYNPEHYAHLVSQHQNSVSDNRIQHQRNLATGYIDRVAQRLGFPRRTIATAQSLYHRFHLHFNLKDFNYQDVSLATILVASKLEDTLKKLRDIQIAAWQVTNLLEGGAGTGEGDVTAQENHRPHLIAIERLVLQTICFNFNLHRSLTPSPEELEQKSVETLDQPSDSTEEPQRKRRRIGAPVDQTIVVAPTGRDVFSWVIRIARSLAASKTYTFLSHLLAIDLYRTPSPLSYPPHTLAASCVYLASFLTASHPNGLEWRGEEVTALARMETPRFDTGWCQEFESTEEDIDEICHSLLNLLSQLCPPLLPTSHPSYLTKPSPSSSFSPSPIFSLPSPSPHHSHTSRPTGASLEREKLLLQTGTPHTFSQAQVQGGTVQICARKEEDFTKIKIRLRELEGERRGRGREKRRWIVVPQGNERGEGEGKDAGKNEEGADRKKVASVRYQF